MLTEIEPEALVTDVQLGDYNGLHLVAIAQVEHPRTTCVVIGPRDPALQSESYHLGARYLVEPIEADRVASILAELVATPRPQRRWPRKRPVHEVPTFVSGIEARIVDVSYGGAGIEVYGDELPGETLQLTVPGTGIAVPVERVWARRTAKAAADGVRCRTASRLGGRRAVAVVRGRPGAPARHPAVAGTGPRRALLAVASGPAPPSTSPH